MVARNGFGDWTDYGVWLLGLGALCLLACGGDEGGSDVCLEDQMPPDIATPGYDAGDKGRKAMLTVFQRVDVSGTPTGTFQIVLSDLSTFEGQETQLLPDSHTWSRLVGDPS